jgi:hypothetical protein
VNASILFCFPAADFWLSTAWLFSTFDISRKEQCPMLFST